MPMAIPAVAAVGGAIFAADKAELGNNAYRAKSFSGTPEYDANRFEYGGRPGGADAAADRYRWGADQAQTRQGEQINYGQANQFQDLGLAARQGQVGMANQMQARAMGLVPSIAQMQADRQMQQATAAQASAAASARGAAGLALAGQNAANNTATMQSAISNQAQINGAQERMQNEQNAFGAYGNLRAGDFGAQQQAAQQAQFQSQVNAQQRAQNDQMSQAYTGFEQNVRGQQLNAGMGQQGLLAGQHMQSQQINAGINQNNANVGKEMTLGVLNAAGSVAGAAAGSDDRMKQGMTYLSDERAKQAAFDAGRASAYQEASDAQIKSAGHLGLASLLSPAHMLGAGVEAARSIISQKKANDATPDVQREPRTVAASPARGLVIERGKDTQGVPTRATLTNEEMFTRPSELRRPYDMSVHFDPPREPVPTYYGGVIGTGEGTVGSDVRMKEGVGDVVPLMDDPNRGLLQMDGERAFFARQPSEDDGRPSLSGPSAPSHLKAREAAPSQASSPAQARRQMTPDEMMLEADRMMAGMRSDHSARMSSGPAVRDVDPVTQQFAEGLAPIRFEYKPGMGPGGERTGVRAQGLLSQPLTSYAVRERPDGMLGIDYGDGMTLGLAAAGHNSRKIAEHEQALAEIQRALRGARR